MKFFAPLALAAVAVAAPVAEAEADAHAQALAAAAAFNYPSYSNAGDISNVLGKLGSYVSQNSGQFTSAHTSLIGVSLNAFIAGLVGIGLNVNVL